MLEQAMAQLIGADNPEGRSPRRSGAQAPRATRLQTHERPAPRAQTLGETAAQAWE